MMAAVGLRDRIAKEAARARELARDAADSEAVQKVRDSAAVQKIADSEPVQSFVGLTNLLTDDDEREFVIERALVTLVRTVRSDDDEPLSDRDLEKAAKRRSKRARRTALLAGPAVGTANQLVDLYCETATVCDVTPDIAVAEAAIRGTGAPVTTLLGQRFGLKMAEHMPQTKSKKDIIKALWKARGVAGDVRENVMGERNITGIFFAGKRVKEFIARAEAALGVA
jgi:hypothetical protein